jgi:ATP adenylyltransferase
VEQLVLLVRAAFVAIEQLPDAVDQPRRQSAFEAGLEHGGLGGHGFLLVRVVPVVASKSGRPRSGGGVVTGVPDNLDRLWAPDRLAYATGEARPAGGYDAPSGCPFCLAPTRPPEEGLVVARGETVFAVLNLYPYNPGHLMVCPYRHVADYTELTRAETVELAEFTQAAMWVVRRVSAPQGFNLGMNQGHVGGAGIAAHLHQHVVPRWAGDTNFMPVIGRTKVLPQLLTDTRALLAKAWQERDPGAAVGARRAARPTKAKPKSGVKERVTTGVKASGRAAPSKRTPRSPAKQ